MTASRPLEHPLTPVTAWSARLAAEDEATRDAAVADLTRALAYGISEPDRTALGDAMTTMLTDPRIQARSSAARVLVELAATGHFPAPWVEAIRRWYPAETDLRDGDPDLGDLDTLCHGADALASIARGGHGAPAPLLATLTRRLLAPTEFAWLGAEPDHLARAIAAALADPNLDEPAATAWLGPIRAVATGSPEPGRPEPANLRHTLRALLVGLREVPLWRGEPISVPLAEPVCRALTQILRDAAPGFWQCRPVAAS